MLSGVFFSFFCTSTWNWYYVKLAAAGFAYSASTYSYILHLEWTQRVLAFELIRRKAWHGIRTAKSLPRFSFHFHRFALVNSNACHAHNSSHWFIYFFASATLIPIKVNSINFGGNEQRTTDNLIATVMSGGDAWRWIYFPWVEKNDAEKPFSIFYSLFYALF